MDTVHILVSYRIDINEHCEHIAAIYLDFDQAINEMKKRNEDRSDTFIRYDVRSIAVEKPE